MSAKIREKTLELEEEIVEINTFIAQIEKDNEDLLTQAFKEEIERTVLASQKKAREIVEASKSLSDRELLAIRDNFSETKAKLNEIVKIAKTKTEENELSLKMYQLAEKLDTIITNQEKEKAKLSEIELKIKNNQADLSKSLLEVPCVPEDKMRLIYGRIIEKFRELILKFNKDGIYFGDKDDKEEILSGLKRSFSVGQNATEKEVVENVILQLKKVSSELISFIENEKDWEEINQEVELRKDFTYEDLERVSKIGRNLDTRVFGYEKNLHFFEKEFSFIEKDYEPSLYISPAVEFLRKNGIKKKLSYKGKKRDKFIERRTLKLR